ncbi:MAG: hypothetical protein LBN07_03185 [Christensenellaceae bacterium]|jgi:fructose-1,6-bisphosphatase/inositol monophosphatase family enzyme|nr:hypothetical protein [Christensenellaceae bacterium]
MEENLEQMRTRVVEIVKAAYEKSLTLKQSIAVEMKEGNDIVSAVDKFMEEQIVGGLKKFYPEHNFLGEESCHWKT